MIWYTGMCGIMAISLLYELTLWLVCVGVGFGSNGFVIKMQSFPIDGYYRTNVISCVGHPRWDLVVSLVLQTVCCAMGKASALYYRSLETTSTLLRKGNISGKPYC
jgi:hypothetical protein